MKPDEAKTHERRAASGTRRSEGPVTTTGPGSRPIQREHRLPYMILKWAVDGLTWLTATLVAFLLRYDGSVPADAWPMVILTALGLGGLKLAATVVAGLHRRSWVKFAFRDAGIMVIAMIAVVTVGTAAAVLLAPVAQIPPTVPAIDGMLTVLLMLGTRGATRHSSELMRLRATAGNSSRHVLLIGAGESGALIAREMLRHPETSMRPVGFLDDDSTKVGRTIAAVPVLGGLEDLPSVLEEESVDEVLIAMPSADGQTIRSIVDRLQSLAPGVPYRTMPALHELVSGKVSINRIRDVGIEDLLRRPPVELDMDSILSYLQGKRVMVTGAGGSIGSELVRQICRFGPAEIILFGHGENSIYKLERELDLSWPDIKYHSVIAAVQNVGRLDYIFDRYRPDVVFHTAAHKHVPLMELNPEEAVFNNIIGSRNLVNLALKHGVSHFVNISTDKAVNPSSVMGASKRMVEHLVEDAAAQANPGQNFVSVRFGNVLGSRGSAIPLFKQQIRAGGPVTVTHPDMTRYFMTIPEAARLVLQASALGNNGEIYILDMGEPVRVLDLVKDLIRLSGLEPEADIPIVFTGIRPGEKMYEELMTSREDQGDTAHEKIFVAKPSPMPSDELKAAVEELTNAALRSDGRSIRQILGSRLEGSRLGRSAKERSERTQAGGQESASAGGTPG